MLSLRMSFHPWPSLQHWALQKHNLKFSTITKEYCCFTWSPQSCSSLLWLHLFRCSSCLLSSPSLQLVILGFQCLVLISVLMPKFVPSAESRTGADPACLSWLSACLWCCSAWHSIQHCRWQHFFNQSTTPFWSTWAWCRPQFHLPPSWNILLLEWACTGPLQGLLCPSHYWSYNSCN